MYIQHQNWLILHFEYGNYIFYDEKERFLCVFLRVILRQKFQNKNSEFPGQHNKLLDYDNSMLLFKIKIFEEMRILNITSIDWYELL